MTERLYTVDDAFVLLSYMRLSMDEKEKEPFKRLWSEFYNYFAIEVPGLISRNPVKCMLSTIEELYVRVLPFYAYTNDPVELMTERSNLRAILFAERVERKDVERRLLLGEPLEELIKH